MGRIVDLTDPTSITDEPVASALKGLQPVRGRILQTGIRYLPWAALAVAGLIAVLELGSEGEVLPLPEWTLLALGFAAVGAVLTHQLMERTKSTLENIWLRRIIDLAPGTPLGGLGGLTALGPNAPLGDADQGAHGGPDPAEGELRLSHGYAAFVHGLDKAMNRRIVDICAAVFFGTVVLGTFYPGGAPPAFSFEHWSSRLAQIGIVALALPFGPIGWRMLVLAVKLTRLGKTFSMRVRPLHPDGSGGLKFLGDLCLLNAVIISIPAIYIGVRTLAAPDAEDTRYILLVFLPVLMFFAGLAFIRPLYGIHLAMVRSAAPLREKLDELGRLTSSLAADLVLRAVALPTEEIVASRERHAALVQVYSDHRRIPQWPVARVQLYRFASSQVIPALGLLIPLWEILFRTAG